MNLPHAPVEMRALVLAPTTRDADLTDSILREAGIQVHCCRDLEETHRELEAGAGALIIPEEVLGKTAVRRVAEWLTDQPAWSDLPVIFMSRPGADSAAVALAMDILGSVTVLERPIRVAALVSAVRSALRARERQYQVRDHIAERERAVRVQGMLAAIVESSDDAIISKSLDGVILTWNAGAERLFGYSEGEMVGQSVMMLIPPDRRDEEPRLLERLRRGERIDHFETVRMTRDGRRIDISLTVSPIRDAAGKVLGASKVARDITERKRAEEALREADRRKDEFLAILAHELRNPLAPLRNSLAILRLIAPKHADMEQLAAMMDRQVSHMVRLVDDLLEVSRITRGKIELRRERTDLAAILRSAVETSQPLIDASGHLLAIDLPAEPVVLDGDPIRLAQVFANLLNNAAKYTEPGGRIGVTAVAAGHEIVVTVRDNGVGIPVHLLPSVFDLFMQLDRNASRAQGGLGIGLTLVKSLVEMHGGRVEARSDGPGQGSAFVVHLPLVHRPEVAAAADRQDPGRFLAGRRVLVVDDNRDSADSLTELLRLLGAETHVVYGGHETLEHLRSFRPHAILLDIGMPEMGGHEVARRIREDPAQQGVVLVALTGWGQEEDRRRSRSAGFDHHLIKPVDLAVLRDVLTASFAGGVPA